MANLTDAERALLIEWSIRCIEGLQLLPPSRNRDAALRTFHEAIERHSREAKVVQLRRS